MNTLALADLISERATDYDLSARAAADRCDSENVRVWAAVAIALRELEHVLRNLERLESEAA